MTPHRRVGGQRVDCIGQETIRLLAQIQPEVCGLGDALYEVTVFTACGSGLHAIAIGLRGREARGYGYWPFLIFLNPGPGLDPGSGFFLNSEL